jgi:hypothetical protein
MSSSHSENDFVGRLYCYVQHAPRSIFTAARTPRDYALFRSSENQAAPRSKRVSRKTLVPADGGGGRVPKPFALHIVGDEAMPSGKSKAEMNHPNG